MEVGDDWISLLNNDVEAADSRFVSNLTLRSKAQVIFLYLSSSQEILIWEILPFLIPEFIFHA